jgi:hypothetical protein
MLKIYENFQDWSNYWTLEKLTVTQPTGRARRHGRAVRYLLVVVPPAPLSRPPAVLDGDAFWLVAVHGTQADYVRNLRAEPRVRVKVGGFWRSGTAVELPGDDPAARSRTLPYQWDAAIGRMMASAPLTIRIDLDTVRMPE